MANKTLHSLQFPGLSDVYVLPEQASEFSTSSTYAVGQYVTYRGILYKCITAVSHAGSWTGATNWSATDVGTELQDTYGPSKPNFSVNNPVMDGTASTGTATTYARSDHRHPSDTNKLNIPNNAGTVGQALTKTATGSTWKTLTEGINPNLLRNWYFVGGGTGRGVFPVNSRGSINYTSISGINCIDGWRMFRGTITVNSSDIYLVRDYSAGGGYAPFHQKIDGYNDLIGKEVTASLLQDDNTLYYDTFTVPSTGTYTSSIFNDTFRFYMNSPSSSSFEIGLVSTNATLHIKAIKLELGDQQTLAHQENSTWVLNEVPDYEEEYYRCITSNADSGDTYANKSLATEQQLAYVETGTTASRAYDVGEYFCWNGLLYQAKTAISSGDRFTVNTNCKQVTDGGFNTLNNNILGRSRQMDITVPAEKSVDIIISGSNYAPSHGFIVVCSGNSGSVIAAWLCLGYGIRTGYHVIVPLHTSSGTSLSLTSTVNGKYTLTNSSSSYATGMTVTVLQESVRNSLSLSEPY